MINKKLFKVDDLKLKIFNILENKSETFFGKLFSYFLFILIIFNVFVATLETVPDIYVQYKYLFLYFEIFSVSIFAIEYVLRLWTMRLKRGWKNKSIFQLVTNPLMIFDFLVLLPSFFSIFFIFDHDLRLIVILKLMRIFRIFRVSRYSIAVDRIISVIKKEKDELKAILILMMILLLISSTFLYLAEHNVPNTQFTSIPATFWWGIATLTTIGYGDVVPITTMGKIFGSITAIFGVGMFALPTGLLGASFYKEVTIRRDKKIKKLEDIVSEMKDLNTDNQEEISKFIRTKDEKIKKLEYSLRRMHDIMKNKGIVIPDFEHAFIKKKKRSKKIKNKINKLKINSPNNILDN